MRARGLGLRVALVAAGLFVGALATEAAIRTFRLVPDHLPMRYREMPGDEVFAPIPDTAVRSLYGIEHRTNSLGLRGPERPVRKPSGTLRVVLLGDSVVWGYGVREEKSLAPTLERMLAGRDPRVEVWNLGQPATDLFNHRARLERLGPRLRPDLVFLFVLCNDLEAGPSRFRITANGLLARPGARAPYLDAWRPFLDRTALLHALLRILRPLPQPTHSEAMRRLAALRGQLDAIATVADDLGSGLVPVLVPGRDCPSGLSSDLREAMASHARARGLRFVALADVLGDPVGETWLLPADPTHPNAEGYRRIAHALAPLVR